MSKELLILTGLVVVGGIVIYNTGDRKCPLPTSEYYYKNLTSDDYRRAIQESSVFDVPMTKEQIQERQQRLFLPSSEIQRQRYYSRFQKGTEFPFTYQGKTYIKRNNRTEFY